MILYEVTAEVRPDLREAFERFMVEHHVPDLLATGCFSGARVSRGDDGSIRMSYEAPDESALRRYLEHHAPVLRADVLARFPEGLKLSRAQWTVVRAWQDDEPG